VIVPKNAFAFKFIGKTLVVYHNQNRKNTFGKGGAKVISYQLKYNGRREKTVSGNALGTSQRGMHVKVGWNGSM